MRVSYRKIRAFERNSHNFPFILSASVYSTGTTFVGFNSADKAISYALFLSEIAGVERISVSDVLNNITIWKNW